MIRRIQPNAVPESDAPFSQMVLDDCYAYLAGLVAADFPHGVAVLGDVGAETRAVMGVVSDMLRERTESFSLQRLTHPVRRPSRLNCSAGQK